MAHGNHWEAITDDLESIAKMMPEIVRKGSLVEALHPQDPNNLRVGEYVGIHYPPDQPLSYLAIIRKEEEQSAFVVCYPAMNDGEKCILEIKSITSEEPENKDFEGIITATMGQDRTLTFFEPHFPINKLHLRGRMRFKLSALAYLIERPNTELEIKKGPMLELEKQRIAEEGGDPNSVHSVMISTRELRCYIPHENGNFEFQSVVEDVQQFSVLGINFFRATILLNPPEESPVAIALFISEKVAGGIVPKVGESIIGTAWLQGIALGQA